MHGGSPSVDRSGVTEGKLGLPRDAPTSDDPISPRRLDVCSLCVLAPPAVA